MHKESSMEEINRKMDVLLKLMAYQTVEKKTLSEGAPLLRRLGFTPAEIASIYDSTANTVNVRLAEAKKKKAVKTKGL
jgi:CRP-like cAMP-binding protein